MSGGPALVATDLRKSYGRVIAVDALALEVAAGTVLGFLGPNGAGKTTAIRMLTTILPADGGSFAVTGIPHTRPDEIRRRVGVLPESAGYPAGQTGAEWLRYHAELFGRSRADAQALVAGLLAEVGLADRARTLVSGYSRGMKQRLGIARALVNDPDVVFLDEPTLGLDPMGQAQVLDLIGRIARERGATVVLSTHVLADVEQICDRVVILNRGRVVAEGTVAEVVRQAAAPRQGRLQVPPELTGRALTALAGTQVRAVSTGGGRLGELELSMPPGLGPEAAATQALTGLLAAGVPVLGFTLEGGRLSDAFLAFTEEA
ncbi:ABC-2 type transport system ATP-binding protein [Kribbella amoyensis]|uniref:ABC-2 type transport system ATP-binding protein n=1 Tax=Kribbella amoyensis TaxID=996641 RepID=A0A561BZ46_9ACTN|nr:ABC transporter ATP-binding protein [Kribbella amoyensis]TWD84164.1 ABC-2 type transport system ATP-binding protein [Kribbella amoyensis]